MQLIFYFIISFLMPLYSFAEDLSETKDRLRLLIELYEEELINEEEYERKIKEIQEIVDISKLELEKEIEKILENNNANSNKEKSNEKSYSDCNTLLNEVDLQACYEDVFNKLKKNEQNIKLQEGIKVDESNLQFTISEIDLLRQQLSSCWIAPAGTVFENWMMVKINAKVRQNAEVIEQSVRVLDTNIPKSNSFYRPIIESALRTLLNPNCTPLKLPVNKYNLWKNITITFDYNMMNSS